MSVYLGLRRIAVVETDSDRNPVVYQYKVRARRFPEERKGMITWRKESSVGANKLSYSLAVHAGY